MERPVAACIGFPRSFPCRVSPALPRQSIGRTRGLLDGGNADFIINFPSSIGFQFLQDCRLRDQLLAHSKPGLPVTILALWWGWWWWWLSLLFSTSFRLGWEIKLGLSKYSFCQHTALKAISVYSLIFLVTSSESSDFRYGRPSWFHMYRRGVGVYSGGGREARKKPSPAPLVDLTLIQETESQALDLDDLTEK